MSDPDEDGDSHASISLDSTSSQSGNLSTSIPVDSDSSHLSPTPMPSLESDNNLASSESSDDSFFGDCLVEGIMADVADSHRHKRIPCRTSTLRGWMYKKELLEGSSVRFLEVLKLEKGAFHHLMAHLGPMLEASKHLTINEQVMIFLYTVGHAVSFRHTAERWQHSTETIHRYFHIVRTELEGLAPSIIVQPGPESEISDRILEDPKLFPWFKGCIGAIDGTHIEAHVKYLDHPKHRNRKGTTSQNVLAACNFDMKFVFIYTGIGGSAHDQFVLNKARQNGHFLVPNGRYYLGDAGYAHRSDIFTPHRGIRYHLQNWAFAARAPQSAEELFNLRHSHLRNVIEHIFGVMKLRTKAMQHMPRLALDHQFSLVVACAVLHNIIRDSGPEDAIYSDYDRRVRELSASRTRDRIWADDCEDNGDGLGMGNVGAALERRAAMGQGMYHDFLAHPRCHRFHPGI